MAAASSKKLYYYHRDLTTNNNNDKSNVSSSSSMVESSTPPVTLPQRKQHGAVARNKKIIELGQKQNYKTMLELFHKERNSFNYVNYATMMNQLGRINPNNLINLPPTDPLLMFVDDLAHQIDRRGGLQQWMGVRQVANIIHAIGKMNLKTPSTEHIVSLVVLNQDNAAWLVKNGETPQAIANIAWACAKLQVNALPYAFFDEIEQRAEWIVKEGTPQAIANIVWSCVKLGSKSPKLFACIEQQAGAAKRLVKAGKPQEIANIAWAFAKLDIKSSALFNEIEQNANYLMKQCNTQDISNIAWAFATLGFESTNLLEEIEHHAAWIVETGKPQEISNTAWAYAKLRNTTKSTESSPALFNEIEKHVEWLVKEGTTQNVANIAWASAILGFTSPKLFNEIEQQSARLVNRGKPQEVASIVWSACSQLKYYAPTLCSEVDMDSKRLVNEGSVQNIANIALAFATTGYDDANNFFSFLEDNIENLMIKNTTNGNEQEICNICYSLVILDLAKKHEKILVKLWECAMAMNPDNFTVSELRQLYQIEAYTKVDDGITTLICPPDALRARMDDSIIIKSGDVGDDGDHHHNLPQSTHQKEISSLLTEEIGFIHEEEISPLTLNNSSGGGLLSIDMGCRERMIAIELDGKYHFLLDLPNGDVSRKVDGRTKAKKRFLERSGWNVITLNYQDKGRVETTKGKAGLIEWLKNELVKAGVI